jgi:hypothetical protein
MWDKVRNSPSVGDLNDGYVNPFGLHPRLQPVQVITRSLA